MKGNKVAIYGAGGFAREVAWLLERCGRADDIVGYIEDDKKRDELRGLPVYEFSELQQAHPDAEITIAIGSPRVRRLLADKCREAGFKIATVIDEDAKYSDSVEIAEGAVICAGSIVTVDIELAEHVHINLDCTVGHDVKIGAFTTVSPGVHISGNVHIGEEVFIGTGASIINGDESNPLIIGDGTVIGAAACVTKPTEPRCLYAGVPALLKKRY